MFKVLFLIAVVFSHTCIHDKIKEIGRRKRRITTIPEIPKPTNFRRGTDGLEILFLGDPIDSEIKNRIASVLKQRITVKNAVNLTSVIPCDLWGDTSEPVAVPDGIDLVLSIKFEDRHCNGTAAYEFTCQRTSKGRPFVAYLNICPIYNILPQELKTINLMHEIIHALGYDGESFTMFPEENVYKGNRDYSYELRGNGALNRHCNQYGKCTDVFVGKNAVQYVRELFNCSSLDYVELDPSGNHLAEYMYHSNIMAPRLELYMDIPKKLLPQLVLEMLKDSDWYTITDAEDENDFIEFGKDAGCKFVNMRCDNYVKLTKDTRFYCLDPVECLVFDYENDIPYKYRYFKLDPKKGGFASSFYCPLRKEYWNPLKYQQATLNLPDLFEDDTQPVSTTITGYALFMFGFFVILFIAAMGIGLCMYCMVGKLLVDTKKKKQ